MNLAQDSGVDYSPGYFDLVSEPSGVLMEYQDTAVTAGATPSILQQIVEFGKTALPAVLSYQQQKELNDLNVERARKGLPPINTQQFTAQSAPQVRMGLTQDTQKLLIYGVVAAAIVGIVMTIARR
jgi:hypothetical protein